MKTSGAVFYGLASICVAAGAIGTAMLAPFFMKERGFSVALVGMPLVVNGLGSLCSDLISGTLASYFRSSVLVISAVAIALGTSLLGFFFRQSLAMVFSAFAILGLTEAMFSLAIRKIVFTQSSPQQQGKAQGQIAAALGIGFALGPAVGGFVGAYFGTEFLFLVYAIPSAFALISIFLAGAHRSQEVVSSSSIPLWRVARRLLAQRGFLAACLAMFQSFFFLIGVTRVGFPFLAVQRGLRLDLIGTMVSVSRLADTMGRLGGGWLCDRIGARSVILLGVFITVPAFFLQVWGEGFLALLLPLCLMTAGFGFSNVGSTTFALQAVEEKARGLSLGLIRAANSIGRIFGPLLTGVLVADLGFLWGFVGMAVISGFIGLAVWSLFRSGSPRP